jgi:hypothetical protein
MKKSKFYDCCIFVALFIVGISLFVTLKLQIEMKNRIAVAAALQAPSTEVFTARNNFTLAPHETREISETVTETSQALTIEETKRETTEKSTEKTTVKPKTETTVASTELDSTLVVNTNSKKIHSSTCSYAGNMKEENKAVISSDELQAYLDEGYAMCSRCKGCKR